VAPRTGLDDVERRKILPLPGLEFRTLGLSARIQSLYRLRYLVLYSLFLIFRIFLNEELRRERLIILKN
jgi:hypothetical protein